MFGFVVWPARRFRMGEERMAGAPFFCAELPEAAPWRMKRLVRRIGRQMEKRRIARAVFPVNFPYMDLFCQQGILPASDLALRRAVAPELLLWKMRAAGIAPERAAVAVLAPASTAEVELLLRELAPRVRYLSLWAGGAGEQLAESLRWEQGVALRMTGRDALFSGVQGALLLENPRENENLPRITVPLWPGSEERISDFFSLPTIRGNPSPEQLLGALFAGGVIKKDAFLPPKVDREKKSIYNAVDSNTIVKIV